MILILKAQKAERGWVLIALAIDCWTLTLPHFTCLTAEMQLLYIPETTNSAASSPIWEHT